MRTRLTFPSAAAALLLGAVLLPLSAGAATPGALAGKVSGAGFALTDLAVSIDGETQVPVQADGSYSAPGITPGKHEVSLVLDDQSAYFARLTITSGATRTYNMAFTKITGHVTKKDTGGAIGNAEVSVSDSADGSYYTETGSDGIYRLLVPVRAVTYVASFYPESPNYLGRYYGNTPDPEKATQFSVSKTATKVISIALPRAAFFQGSMRVPLDAGVDGIVTVYKVGTTTAGRGAGQEAYQIQGGNSKYRSYGLEPGTYRIGFGRASGYALAPGHFYNGTFEAHPASAAKVTLTSGSTRTLASAQKVDPKLGGRISGSIYKVSGGKKVGRKGMRVVAVPTNKLLSTRSAVTGAGGKYLITGLSPGEYKVYVWNSEYPAPGRGHCVQQGLGTRQARADKTSAIGARKFTATYWTHCDV
ncbi:MAG: S-layer domain protein [Marmoricola sp.]|nr:S-layer domain protein [Marmoricola sp.]